MIDNVRMTAVVPVAGGTTAKAGGGRAAVATQTDHNTTASAGVSRLLSLVADLTEAPPPVDYARIAQIRRAIADGSYKVDPDMLAKAIVAHVLPE